MIKISRNDPCPCGSGKKHKKCCLLNKPALAAVSDTIEQLQTIMEQQNFGSIEEMHSFMAQHVETQNSRPPPDFNGLSPSQVHDMLHEPLANQSLLGWQKNIDEQALIETPMMQICLPLIELLNNGPLKATAKGNLPAKAVQHVFAQCREQLIEQGLIYGFQVVKKEDDFVKLNVIRLLLKDLGIIKFQKNHYSITKKGQGLSIIALYQTLFEYYIETYNWGYEDRMADSQFIARSTFFSLRQLAFYQQENRSLTTDDFTRDILDRFPMAIEDFCEDPYSTPQEEALRAYNIRMLERFWAFFGFITIEQKSRLDPQPFKANTLFKQLFWFKDIK